MHYLDVKNEVGRLRKVLLHKPGKELENLTPKWLDQLLFDDIPWLDLAQKEHDAFANILRSNGVEVLYLTDLVSEALQTNPKVKTAFIEQFIEESHITSETLSKLLIQYLHDIPDVKEMIAITMAGIRKTDLPHFTKRTLSDYIRDYPFITDPMPNLYFTRDPFAIIGSGIAISKMFKSARSRETIYGQYIFSHHPIYGNSQIPHFYARNAIPSLEGGDILVLNDKTIAVGISERTHPAAIERLAKQLFYQHQTSFETVLAIDIPKTRAYMHLDTIFTQVNVDTFLIHHNLDPQIETYEIIKDKNTNNKLLVSPLHLPLKDTLSTYMGMPITLIPCGGNDIVASDREQWNDGANTLAIAPGEVIVYERNHITNDILNQHGIKVHTMPSSELSRGRGGPRCMSMPFIRDTIHKEDKK